MNTLVILNALTLAVSLASRLIGVAEQLRPLLQEGKDVTPEQMADALALLDAEIARAKKIQAIPEIGSAS